MPGRSISPDTHNRGEGAIFDPLHAAREDYDAVVKLTRELVRVPSRGGIDPYEPVLECIAVRLGEHGLACRLLAGPGEHGRPERAVTER